MILVVEISYYRPYTKGTLGICPICKGRAVAEIFHEVSIEPAKDDDYSYEGSVRVCLSCKKVIKEEP